MTKIRDRMTTAFAVFAGIFIIYIVLDWGMDITGRKGRSGKYSALVTINDTEISYEEFAAKLNQAIEQQKQQNEGKELDESQVENVREQLFNSVVNEELLKQEAERIGLSVNDDEIREWVFGNNPPQFLTQQFIDSTGNLNRDQYETALKDPRNKTIIMQVEQTLRQMRLQEKVQSALMSSIFVSEGEVVQKFSEQNIHLDAEYILFDPNVLVKDSIAVSDDDVQTFFREHSDEYRQEPSRRLAYVLFKEEPTLEDTNAVLRDFEDIKRKANNGEDFIELQKHYSDVPVSDVFFKHGELSKDREDAIFSAAIGDVVGPIKDFDGFHLIKIVEEKNDTTEFIRASHILLKFGEDSLATKKLAQEVYQRAKKGEDFAKLASQYSADGSASSGGDLGWFGKGRMVKPFEDAAFKAKRNEIVGPVRTQFGLHIIKVTGNDNRALKISDIVMKIEPSAKTRNDVEKEVQNFHKSALEIGFDSVAKMMNREVRKTASFNKKSTFVPGIGQHSRLVRFAFENDSTVISDIISTQQGNGVFKVIDIREEGTKPFNEIEASLKARTLRAKKMERLKPTVEQFRAKLSAGDSLGKLKTFDTTLNVLKANAFTLNGSVTGIGRDLYFLGAVSPMNKGDISSIVESPNRGFFIIHVLNRTPFDSASFAAEKETLRKQLYDSKRSKFMNEWLQNLKTEATIIDNRDTFFR